MKNFFKQYLYLSLFLKVVLIAGIWFFLVAEGEYGVTLFFTIPVSIGFIIGYVKYSHKRYLDLVEILHVRRN